MPPDQGSRRRGFWLEGARALFNLLGVHRSGVILLLLFGEFQQALLSAEAPGVVVAHVPAEPKSGQAVVVTVEGKNIASAKELTLQYQVVEPGDYIALADAAFTKVICFSSRRKVTENSTASPAPVRSSVS